MVKTPKAANDNPIGVKLAGIVDKSLDKRLKPFVRLVKESNELGHQNKDAIGGLRKEVDEIKARPTQDPAQLLAEMLGSMEASLKKLDDEAVVEITEGLTK